MAKSVDGGHGHHDRGKIPDSRRVVKRKKPTSAGFPEPPAADLLRSLRRSAGFKTQDELADALGVQRTTVSDWERGAHLPRGEKLRQLSEVLGVDVERFVKRLPGALRISDEGEIRIIGTVAAGDPEKVHIALTRLPDDEAEAIRYHAGTFALRVDGDSMNPVARDGQCVICDDVPPLPGDLVVCCLQGGGAMFRRYETMVAGAQLVLSSANPTRPKVDVVEAGDIESLERVIGVRFICD